MVDLDRVGHVGRVVQVEHPSVGHVNPVHDRRRGRDQVQVEFARQPLLDDFEVQQAEKAAAEAETERRRGFRLVDEAGVVEAQFREAVAQLFVIGGVGREQAAEHDRLHRLEAGERLGAGRRSSVIVSPTRQSATALMPAVIKPISPGPSSGAATPFGVKTPTRST